MKVVKKENVGRYSVVGLATRYGLDRPAIESQWRRDFPHPSSLVLALPPPPTSSSMGNGYISRG
jgi:hypothetical protein